MQVDQFISLVFLGLISTFPEILKADTEINSTTIESPTSSTVYTTTVQPNLFSNTDIPCTEIQNPCKISEGQICQANFCKCAYSNLTYDKTFQKCFAQVGFQCGFFIGLQNESTVSCPENAICALINMEMVTDGAHQYSSHECACKYTHYRTDSGECAPLGQHGEVCDDKRKCNTEGELICTNGTCQCQLPEDQFFDTQLLTCMSFAGRNCTRACVQNSMCDFYGSGKCQCNRDFRINADLQCETIPPGYLSPCLGEKELCNSEIGLKCIDKVCQCHNPLHQIYEFQLDKCIGLAGDICDPGLTDNCVSNAKCVKGQGGQHERHVCQCIEGFTTTPFRKCLKGHGQECSQEFCNVYRGLACVNSTCQCYDSFLKYDDVSKACLSSEGSPCGKVFVQFPGDWIKSSCPTCDSYYFACDSGSICTRDFIEGNELGSLEKFRCLKKI